MAKKNKTYYSSLTTHVAIKYEPCIKEIDSDGRGIYIELNEGYEYEGENTIYAEGTAEALKLITKIKKVTNG